MRIYESDALKHEYLPYKKGGVLGLYDTVDKVVKQNSRGSANPFKIGGKGVDGAERWIVSPQNRRITKRAGSVVLSANASGAVSYRWTKNGEPVAGGADGDLTVEWVTGGATDTYAVTPVYDVYGREVDGLPVSCTVENLPQSLMIFIQ